MRCYLSVLRVLCSFVEVIIVSCTLLFHSIYIIFDSYVEVIDVFYIAFTCMCHLFIVHLYLHFLVTFLFIFYLFFFYLPNHLSFFPSFSK